MGGKTGSKVSRNILETLHYMQAWLVWKTREVDDAYVRKTFTQVHRLQGCLLRLSGDLVPLPPLLCCSISCRSIQATQLIYNPLNSHFLPTRHICHAKQAYFACFTLTSVSLCYSQLLTAHFHFLNWLNILVFAAMSGAYACVWVPKTNRVRML